MDSLKTLPGFSPLSVSLQQLLLAPVPPLGFGTPSFSSILVTPLASSGFVQDCSCKDHTPEQK